MIIDAFDLMMNDKQEFVCDEAIPIDEALVDCLNTYGLVDVEYIAKKSGLPVERVIVLLKGVIYQDPEPYLLGKEYDCRENWQLSCKYLSGNIRNKLIIAQRAESELLGDFSENVEKLKSMLPEKVNIDDIYISLGASWIPPEEISNFIVDFLRLKETPKVHFYKDLLKYKVVPTEELRKSVLNTITYGVVEEFNIFGKIHNNQYLTAIDIIQQTLNAKTIKVYDYLSKDGIGEYERVLNHAKTVEAQEKQKIIVDAFRDYVYSSTKRIALFEELYNDSLVSYSNSVYDGSFLKLPELNSEVVLFKHQRDAIARILLSGSNLLLSHDMGTGKTYELIVSAHELYRMKISKKNLIVVPNNILKSTVDAHKYLYKKDKILAVYPKDFTPLNRNRILQEIRDGDYVAVYMAYSSFDMITMSKSYQIRKRMDEIKKLEVAAFNSSFKDEKRAIASRIKALKKKLTKYIETEKESEWLCFDKLGIETLMVDEAHNYKNIEISTKTDGVVGMGNSSRKCREMLEKVHYVDRVVFATGTPLTNSLSDLFAFQTYLQPKTLKFHQINTFDAWVNTFGQRETSIECDVDANSKNLRAMTRFSSFHNLGELMSLFSQVCDFYHIDEKKDGLPEFYGYTDVTVPKNKPQVSYMANLSERTDKIRNKEVCRYEDNLLKVTTDGRLAALDIRLVDYDFEYDDSIKSKTQACAENVFEVYKLFDNTTQIVFSDIGTPKSDFNVYDELLNQLVKLGVPKNEIAFVHDATSEAARAKLFRDMNDGVLRVVVGSTMKLGVGVNVQQKLIAIHHLSIPWRPADMEQREARILRMGNLMERVFIFRYITKGSFDAYSWQLLENKQRFISSFLSRISSRRDVDDIADTVLNYAEIKALAIGNPLIKKRVEVSNVLERTKIAFRRRQRELQQLNAVVHSIPQKLEKLAFLSDVAKEDYDFYLSRKESIPNDERIAFGEELLLALKDNFNMPKARFFDTYQSFNILLPEKMSKNYPHIVIESPNCGGYFCEIDLDNKTPIGCTKSIDYIFEHLLQRAEKYNDESADLIKQLKNAKQELKKGNPLTQEVEKLKEELKYIDSLLEEQAKPQNQAG